MYSIGFFPIAPSRRRASVYEFESERIVIANDWFAANMNQSSNMIVVGVFPFGSAMIEAGETYFV